MADDEAQQRPAEIVEGSAEASDAVEEEHAVKEEETQEGNATVEQAVKEEATPQQGEELQQGSEVAAVESAEALAPSEAAVKEEREELDVMKVVSRAEAAMRSAGAPSAARSILDGALLEWEDAIREGLMEGEERSALEEKVVDLYMAYGHMERSLKQFRQAAKVYDTASQSNVASRSVKFWMDYAAFAIDRTKYETARDLYARALHSLPGDEDAAPLWEALVSLARTHLGQPTATLQSVRSFVFPDEEVAQQPVLKKLKSSHIQDARDELLPLIFSSSFEQKTSEDPENIASRAGLDAQTVKDIVDLAREPTLVEVIEGCRVVAALQTAEIEETWASLRRDQARRLRQAADIESRRKCFASFKKENEELEKNTKLELRRLNDGIQSILKVTGLPQLAKSDDADVIATQRAVLQAALASSSHLRNGRSY